MKKLLAIIIAAMLVLASVSMVACDGDWLFGTPSGDVSGDVSGDTSGDISEDDEDAVEEFNTVFYVGDSFFVLFTKPLLYRKKI